jgi:hypothetical protein
MFPQWSNGKIKISETKRDKTTAIHHPDHDTMLHNRASRISLMLLRSQYISCFMIGIFLAKNNENNNGITRPLQTTIKRLS